MVAPKLRFKEFEGDWEKKTLGEVVKFSNGRRIPLSESDRQKRQGTYRYYGASGVIDYIDDYIFDGQYILIGEDGANILTRSSTLAFVVEGKFWVNNHAHIFQSKKGDNTFLATYLESLNYEKYNSGTAQPKLNLENLKKVIVADPSKEEQTKIASFLSNVDEKISQLTQKREVLSQYKQGMMQKLFSQQIRFKADDGSEFGEWEEKTIQYFLDQNYIFDQMDGNHGELYPKSEEFSDSGIPYIGATDFSNGTVNFLSCKKIPLERAIKFKKGIAKNGDVLFAHNATVGPVALLMTNLEFVILSTTATYYRCNPKKLINTYLKSVLESDYFKKQYVGIMSQSTRNQVPITTQRKLNLVVPCLEEQTKIANFLSAIDQKIEVVAQQIEQAKTWKKGLLQQMFV